MIIAIIGGDSISRALIELEIKAAVEQIKHNLINKDISIEVI